MKSHPAAYAWVCETKQLFSFCLGGVLCPKISLSIPTDGLITGPLRHAGMLVCAALRQHEAARRGYKYLTTNHVHTLSQGCTSPAATRTATTGKFSATRAEGSAGASTSTAERWWAPESMATQIAVSKEEGAIWQERNFLRENLLVIIKILLWNEMILTFLTVRQYYDTFFYLQITIFKIILMVKFLAWGEWCQKIHIFHLAIYASRLF